MTMWARNLTREEEEHLKNSLPEISKKINFWGSVAVMGPVDHLYIRNKNSKLTSYRVHLGAGEYIDEVMGGGAAPEGGKKVEIIWSISTPLGYLRSQCEDIPILYHPWCENIVYFPNNYIDKFTEALSFADKALYKCFKNKSLLSKWFGSIYPEEHERNIIMEGVSKILKQ